MEKLSRDLLRYLDERSEWKTASMLAVHFGVSVRKIKYLIKELNAREPLVLSSRRGYTSNPEMKKRIQDLVVGNPLEPETRKERRDYLIKRLILDDEGLDLYDLEEELFLNFTTLRQEILETKKFLEDYQLKLTASNHIYRVEGSEKQKRRAMSVLMMQEAGKGMLLNHALSELFSEKEEKEIRAVLKRNLEGGNLYVNDFAFLNLEIHLLIMIERNRSGKLLQAPQAYDRKTPEAVEKFVQAVFDSLEQNYRLEFQPWDRRDFMLLVESQTQIQGQGEQMDVVRSLLDGRIYGLFEQIVERVRKEYYLDLNNSPFLVRFALHLKNLLLRMELESTCHNPYTEYIKLSCPMIYEVCVCIADIIFEYSGCYINEDEIAFLALHLGTMFDSEQEQVQKIRGALVCPQYHDLAEWMKQQVERQLGDDLSLTRIVGNEEALNEYQGEYDLILSTISFHGHYRQEVIYVTPLLTEADLANIRASVRHFQEKQEREAAGKLFYSVFDEALFCYCREEAGREEILKKMCGKLEKEGYVDGTYYERVKSREQLSPTVYGKIAIPHSLKACARKSGICVFILEKPAAWGDRQAAIVLMLAIHPEEQQRFNEIWDRITRIFSSDDAIARLVRCHTYGEFMESLVSWI